MLIQLLVYIKCLKFQRTAAIMCNICLTSQNFSSYVRSGHVSKIYKLRVFELQCNKSVQKFILDLRP